MGFITKYLIRSKSSQIIYIGDGKLFYRKRLQDQNGYDEVLLSNSNSAVIASLIFHRKYFNKF